MKLSDKVYQTLKDEIVNLKLAPGAPMSEVEVSEKLGASRTPVREAFQKLAREGLVRIVPGRAVFVAVISAADIVELAQMREALESQSARLASESPGRAVLSEFVPLIESARPEINEFDNSAYYRLARRLDTAIANLATNERLKKALEEVWAQAERMRQMSATNAPRLRETVDEHLAIIDAIVAGDAQRADQETRKHQSGNLDNLTKMMRSEKLVQTSVEGP